MRQEKQLLLEEVKEQIEKDSSFIIMRYGKLSANKFGELRREVGKMGGNVEVMRKRILLRASREVGIELDSVDLTGHIGVVYGGHDPLETTKFVFQFSQQNDKSIEVIGGRFDGQLYHGPQVLALSQLPTKDEMRAQFLGLLEAPMAQTLAVMDAIMSSVIYCLDNKVKLEENGEVAP
ncbi:MAG: 50S ribosomal protein L10 [Parachlamydiaceae bacterium]|nr:50S ribosomal protein L10 [Parachlamydiaceae bacterium]